MSDQPTVLSTPEHIAAWVLLSRIHQLALELTTPLRSRGNIMLALYHEGWLEAPLRGTRRNKQAVFGHLVEAYASIRPSWTPGPTVVKALDDMMREWDK